MQLVPIQNYCPEMRPTSMDPSDMGAILHKDQRLTYHIFMHAALLGTSNASTRYIHLLRFLIALTVFLRHMASRQDVGQKRLSGSLFPLVCAVKE